MHYHCRILNKVTIQHSEFYLPYWILYQMPPGSQCKSPADPWRSEHKHEPYSVSARMCRVMSMAHLFVLGIESVINTLTHTFNELLHNYFKHFAHGCLTKQWEIVGLSPFPWLFFSKASICICVYYCILVLCNTVSWRFDLYSLYSFRKFY